VPPATATSPGASASSSRVTQREKDGAKGTVKESSEEKDEADVNSNN